MQDRKYWLLDVLWDVVQPYALKLRDIIMQNPSLFRQPPGLGTPSTLPQTKVPSLATRRAACTHLTMERLYGDFRCNVCNHSSELGWVYSCTQDDEILTKGIGNLLAKASNGFINELNRLTNVGDRMKYGPSPLNGAEAEDEENTFTMPTAELSPSVENAITEGHYTAEQVATLRAQKQHVVDVAQAAIANASAQQDATTQSVDSNPHLPIPVISEVKNTAPTDISSGEKLSETPKLQMFPYCKFRACQLCRPTYRDRTWQCFEEIFALKPPIPMQIVDSGNRPLASASVMRRIGLRSAPRGRPRLRHLNSGAVFSFDGDVKPIFKNQSKRTPPSLASPTDSGDVADVNISLESKSFRESMKRALKGMLATRQHQQQHNQARSSGRKRRGRESTTASDEDAAEFDVGLWKKMNDELLDEASSVPLPAKDSIETLSEGVQRTDIAGVAVTEEAADLKSADIIVSV